MMTTASQYLSMFFVILLQKLPYIFLFYMPLLRPISEQHIFTKPSVDLFQLLANKEVG